MVSVVGTPFDNKFSADDQLMKPYIDEAYNPKQWKNAVDSALVYKYPRGYSAKTDCLYTKWDEWREWFNDALPGHGWDQTTLICPTCWQDINTVARHYVAWITSYKKCTPPTLGDLGKRPRKQF